MSMSSGITDSHGGSQFSASMLNQKKSKNNDFESSSDSTTKIVREYFPETWLWNIEILK
jgi:hypothetical protein